MSPKAEATHISARRVVNVDLAELDAVRCDIWVVFVFSDVQPVCGAAALVDWRACGALSRAMVRGFVAGGLGETTLLPAPARLGGGKIVVVGMGPEADCGPEAMAAALGQAEACLSRLQGPKVTVACAPMGKNAGRRDAFVALCCACPGQLIEQIVLERLH